MHSSVSLLLEEPRGAPAGYDFNLPSVKIWSPLLILSAFCASCLELLYDSLHGMGFPLRSHLPSSSPHWSRRFAHLCPVSSCQSDFTGPISFSKSSMFFCGVCVGVDEFSRHFDPYKIRHTLDDRISNCLLLQAYLHR